MKKNPIRNLQLSANENLNLNVLNYSQMALENYKKVREMIEEYKVKQSSAREEVKIKSLNMKDLIKDVNSLNRPNIDENVEKEEDTTYLEI